MKPSEIIKIDNVIQLKQPNVKTAKVKHIASTLMHDGHDMYEFNKVNFQLDLATFEEIPPTYIIGEHNSPSKKIIVREHCYYFNALNIENAIKKIMSKFNPEFVAVMLPE